MIFAGRDADESIIQNDRGGRYLMCIKALGPRLKESIYPDGKTTMAVPVELRPCYTQLPERKM